LIASLDKIQKSLKEWLEGYEIQHKDNKNTSLRKSPNSLPDDHDDFSSKALNFLSKNPDWSREADLSESFQQKMLIKNMDEVAFCIVYVD